MINAIITDLDDTLLKYDKTVSEFTLQTLKQCKERGIKTIFASARSMARAKLFLPLDLFDGYVVSNGAKAVADNHVVYEKIMEPEIFVPFLKKLDSENIKTAVQIGKVHYSNFDIPDRIYEITDFNNIKERAEKLYAINDSPDITEFIKKWLPKELCVHFTKDNFALVSHREAVKINALSSLLDYWNIPFSNSVAFGDDINDKDMIEKCGIGVAMDNAIEEIKKASNEICGNCDNDGVAEWLSNRIL